MKVNKLNDNTISVEKIETSTKTATYDINFLVKQRATIVADAEAYAKARQKEIDEVDMLLSECEKLGVVITEEIALEEEIALKEEKQK